MQDAAVIDSYNRLPIGKYLRLCEVAEDKTLDEVDRQVKCLAILYDCTEADILALPIMDYKARVITASFLLNEPPVVKPRLADRYVVGSFTLIPTRKLKDITTAQFIDYEAFAEDADKNICEILSCFLVPDGCRYNDGYDPVDVQNAIRQDMPVTDVLSVAAFFLTQYVHLLNHSLTSSRRLVDKMKDRKERAKAKRMLDRMEMALRNGGAGLQTLMQPATFAGAPGRTSGE